MSAKFKIVHEEETPDKSSQPASSSSDDRPELPKRRKSTPHKKVGYKNKKKRQQLKRKTVDHQRRPPTLGDDRDVDGGACCRHCCCCRCHEVISYTHGEGASVGRRNVERFGRKPARLDRKRLTPKKTMLKKDRNSTPSPLRAKRRQLMEGQIEDDCLEDVRLASVIVNRGEECFRNAVAECGAKPKGCNNIDRATNLESQEP
uniref:Uncharacterized protein n=1 Tax=Romanomermis culicivorax TaxID=13658 RepID=A0A915ISY2_ROMCU